MKICRTSTMSIAGITAGKPRPQSPNESKQTFELVLDKTGCLVKVVVLVYLRKV